MAGVAAVGVAVAGAVATGVEQHQAEVSANRAIKPKLPEAPTAPVALNAADELKKANMLAQTAGGSLLSDPRENARNATGTLTGTGKSLLGS